MQTQLKTKNQIGGCEEERSGVQKRAVKLPMGEVDCRVEVRTSWLVSSRGEHIKGSMTLSLFSLKFMLQDRRTSQVTYIARGIWSVIP